MHIFKAQHRMQGAEVRVMAVHDYHYWNIHERGRMKVEECRTSFRTKEIVTQSSRAIIKWQQNFWHYRKEGKKALQEKMEGRKVHQSETFTIGVGPGLVLIKETISTIIIITRLHRSFSVAWQRFCFSFFFLVMRCDVVPTSSTRASFLLVK